MADAELTAELQEFIADHIQSLEKLEILLLLSGSPEKAWSIAEVNGQIQSSPSSVAEKLKELTLQSLVAEESENVYRYRPATEKLKASVSVLEGAYKIRRIKVIEVIFSDKTERLRNFANAFRIRKEKE